MDYQKLYWSTMTQFKFEQLCVESSYRRSITALRRLKIFLAIISSSALASWVIWDSYPRLWGGIIAFSCVISAINECTPYQKRISGLSDMSDKLCDLFQDVEDGWFDVCEGKMTEEEIFRLRGKYVRDWEAVTNKGLTEDFAQFPKSIRTKCLAETNDYFRDFNGDEHE